MIGNWNYEKLTVFLDALYKETNDMAEEIKAIKDKMPGRGIYPAESATVIARLENIENRLRQIASNKERPL